MTTAIAWTEGEDRGRGDVCTDVRVQGVAHRHAVDRERRETVADAEHGHPFDAESVARARSAQLSPEEVDRLAEVLSIVGERVRARVVCALLAVDELCVGDVALAAGISDDAASYALRVLRTAGFVQRRREGRLNFYRLADDDTQPALRSALRELRRLAGTTPPRLA